MEIVSQSDNKERQTGGMEEALRKRGKPGREPTGSRGRGVTAPNVKPWWGRGESHLKNNLRAAARDLHC